MSEHPTFSKVDVEKSILQDTATSGALNEALFELDPADHPHNFTVFKKWIIVIVISLAAVCVTSASSVAAFTQKAVAEEFDVAHVITILSVSFFVLGLALGPLLIGPLSEVYGRNPIYRGSYLLFWTFSWPVAFAPNIGVYLVFRFFTGFCGSAFLSVAGGSVGDLFTDKHVAGPMSFYAAAPFLGPVMGPLISGFINQNLYWRWTWRIMLIWVGIQCLAIWILVPETYLPDEKFLLAVTGHSNSSFTIGWLSCLTYGLTSLILAILYLTFQCFPLIFQAPAPPDGVTASVSNSKHDNPTPVIYGHAFSMQQSGMTFLGIGVGMIFAGVVPGHTWWSKLASRCKQAGTPEARLLMGEFGGVLVPIGLYVIAFTTYPNVHWIVPIIGSIPFGMGVYYVFTSVFTYLVVAYRPIAASAMASNTAMRCSLSAVLPLFATPMYNRMGTVGATVFLAGVMTLTAPFPFIFRRIGGRLRKHSRFALQ